MSFRGGESKEETISFSPIVIHATAQRSIQSLPVNVTVCFWLVADTDTLFLFLFMADNHPLFLRFHSILCSSSPSFCCAFELGRTESKTIFSSLNGDSAPGSRRKERFCISFTVSLTVKRKPVSETRRCTRPHHPL